MYGYILCVQLRVCVSVDVLMCGCVVHMSNCVFDGSFKRKTRGRLLHLAKRFGPKRAFFSCRRVQNLSCKMSSTAEKIGVAGAHVTGHDEAEQN